MSELTIELDKLIQKAALDGALTQKAVDMFHTMLKENEELRESLEERDRFERERNITMGKLETDLRIAQGLNKVAAEMEASLINREQKITVLEMQAKYELTRVEDHKEMFTTVFRNSVLRKEVMTPVDGLKADQYGTSHSPYVQKDSVEEEET